MGVSDFYGQTDEREALATLERALELGVNFLDTADMYGVGKKERFLGGFVRAHRERVVIGTKFGYARTPQQPDDWSLDNRPEHIRPAVEASLQRLGIETIDLYYMQRRNQAVPLEDSVGTMAALVKAGKVRALAGGERAAAIYSLVHTAKLNGLDPEAYLREVLGRIADHPICRIEELLPWNIGKGEAMGGDTRRAA